MTYANLAWIVLAIGLVIWIGYRQLTWQPLTPRGAWLAPLVMMGIGLVSATGQLSRVRIEPVSVGIVALELVLSLGLGALMGRITQFRRLPEGSVDRRGNRALWATRTGWAGLGLWVLLIVVRLGIDLWARFAHIGGGLLTTTAVIMFVIGMNRLARSAVLQLRLGRSEFAPVAAAE